MIFKVIQSPFFTGVLKEGRLLHKELDAQQMADALRTCIGQRDSLTCAGQAFLIEKVKFDSESGKYSIYMRKC
jgi:hypothetical protein